MIDRLEWLGHGSFILHSTPTVYLNPWRVVPTDTPADLILLGSADHDAFSPSDIAKLAQPHTTLIAAEAVAEAARAAFPHLTLHVLRAWQTITIGRVGIKAIPASPIELPDAGFVISYNYYDLYYAGKVGLIPELAALRPDVAILPIDSATLTQPELIEAVTLLRPRQIIPCNWPHPGGRVDAQVFARQIAEHAPASQVVLFR